MWQVVSGIAIPPKAVTILQVAARDLPGGEESHVEHPCSGGANGLECVLIAASSRGIKTIAFGSAQQANAGLAASALRDKRRPARETVRVRALP
jgi:hypothetical protein